jgi:hypothetical protein
LWALICLQVRTSKAARCTQGTLRGTVERVVLPKAASGSCRRCRGCSRARGRRCCRTVSLRKTDNQLPHSGDSSVKCCKGVHVVRIVERQTQKLNCVDRNRHTNGQRSLHVALCLQANRCGCRVKPLVRCTVGQNHHKARDRRVGGKVGKHALPQKVDAV